MGKLSPSRLAPGLVPRRACDQRSFISVLRPFGSTRCNNLVVHALNLKATVTTFVISNTELV